MPVFVRRSNFQNNSLKIKKFNETHMFCQVFPGPVPGPDPDGLLRDDHGGVAQVASAGLRGLEEGEAPEADVRRAHIAFVLFQRGKRSEKITS